MKKIISLFVLVIIITACSSSDDSNSAPSTPSVVSPNNTCEAPAVVFTWNASSDAEGNAITYKVEISKTSSFEEISHSVDATSTTATIDLEANKSFYWRVKATDDKGLASGYSTAASFTTASTAINQLPNIPELVSPALNSSVTTPTTTLSWTCSDPDAGDTLVYDVYFGTSTAPTQKIVNGENITSKEVNLPKNGLYYWKVVARDTKGEATTSEVWTFSVSNGL